VSPDQRLIGMDLIELRALAFGGDPAVAEQVGQRLSRAAAALEQVSASLERAASQVGLGWQGRASDAARTGIAGHAQWARIAAARTSAAGGNASAQAASAAHVRANMPDPGVRSAALGAGGSPVGTNPVGTNMAQAEEARRNAQLRAVELLEGHAAKSEAQRPTGAIEAPPGGPAGAAATTAGRGTATRARAPGRIAGPATTAAEGTPPARPFTGDRSASAARPGQRAGAAGGGTAGAAARAGAPLTRSVNATNGGRPLPGPAGYEFRGPVEAAGIGPGVLAASPAGAGPAVTGRRRGWARGVHAEQAGVGAGRGGEPPALRARHGAGVNQATDPQASQSGPGERNGHRLREGAEAGGGMAAPLGGAIGSPTRGAPSRSAHRRLGFLIDEDCAFDGDSGWVSPPVIGA
jgi:hypothetical protein